MTSAQKSNLTDRCFIYYLTQPLMTVSVKRRALAYEGTKGFQSKPYSLCAAQYLNEICA